MKICPFCAEGIQDAAVVCKHCGRDIVGPPAVPQEARVPTRGFSGWVIFLVCFIAFGLAWKTGFFDALLAMLFR